jgi:integrase/recombinase XerD
MVDVNDPHNYEQDLEVALWNYRESTDVDNESHRAVVEWASAQQKGHVPDDEELATSTLADYVTRVRLLVEGIDSPLLDADKDELDEYIEHVRHSKAASTHNNTLCAVYSFSDFHDLGLRGEWEWVEREVSKVDVDRLFSDEEVNDLIDEGNAREQVIVGVLADTGCRIGALCSFRIRDVDIGTSVPQLAFNTNAATKSAEGKVLLTWAEGHIENYLGTDHPRPDDPNAPLLHKKEQFNLEGGDYGALSPSRCRAILKDLGERVGIPRDRMKPHNFRHTAVSNWIRQGYTTEEIIQQTSWAGPEMLEIYDNVTDEKKNEDLASRLGIVDDEEIVDDPSEATIPCPRCDYMLRRNANFCPRCSLQMSRSPAFEEAANEELPAPDEQQGDDPMPGTIDPGEVWGDGAGADLLDEMEPETVLLQLLQRDDVDLDIDDLLDE